MDNPWEAYIAFNNPDNDPERDEERELWRRQAAFIYKQAKCQELRHPELVRIWHLATDTITSCRENPKHDHPIFLAVHLQAIHTELIENEYPHYSKDGINHTLDEQTDDFNTALCLAELIWHDQDYRFIN